jgi:hypothetical protein
LADVKPLVKTEEPVHDKTKTEEPIHPVIMGMVEPPKKKSNKLTPIIFISLGVIIILVIIGSLSKEDRSGIASANATEVETVASDNNIMDTTYNNLPVSIDSTSKKITPSPNVKESGIGKSKIEEKKPSPKIRDPRRKDVANVFWNGEYPLYSLVDDIEIVPDRLGFYPMWIATNENKKPEFIVLAKGDIKPVYKFRNFEECNRWCRGY